MKEKFIDYNQALASKKLGFEEKCYVFSSKELRELLKDYTNNIIKNVTLEHRLYNVDGSYTTTDLGEEICLNDIEYISKDYCGVNKSSIINQLEIILNEYSTKFKRTA